MPINILMPALSPTMEVGNLAKWLVKEGDTVAAGDVIAEIETDKATMEVEAVDEGTVAKLVVPEGAADVPVNKVIAMLAGEGEDASRGAPPPRPRSKRRRPKAEGGAAERAASTLRRRPKPRLEGRGCCESLRQRRRQGQRRRPRLRLAAGPAAGRREQARPGGADRLRPARAHRAARHRGGAEERRRHGRAVFGSGAPARRPPCRRRACRTSRSWRSTRRAPTRSSRTTMCARSSPGAWSRRSRRSRISTSPWTAASTSCWRSGPTSTRRRRRSTASRPGRSRSTTW